jgi:hypothetical protein
MPEPVEVAIESALLTRAQAFALAQSLTISLPNVAFTPPVASPTAKWLRASFLPAPSVATGIPYDAHIQHYGIFQVDVFYGLGGGDLAPARIASSVISYFQRGTSVTKDGFTAQVTKSPYRGPTIKDDTWMMIPVSIPYLCFARPT